MHDELNQWGLQVNDVNDAEIDESTVENVRFVDFRTFRTAGEGKDILVVGRIEMDVKVSYHLPSRLGHGHIRQRGQGTYYRTTPWRAKRISKSEADFSMTLKVDGHGKPTSIAEFSFDDDNFVWVSIGPNDYDVLGRLGCDRPRRQESLGWRQARSLQELHQRGPTGSRNRLIVNSIF